jgi:hypothetical protein
MWYKFTDHAETRHAGIALAVLLSAALSLPAHSAEIWKIDPAKSKFSSDTATLSIARDAKGLNQTAGKVIVISKGNVYLVTGAAASNGSGLKLADYSHMANGKAVLIGTNARSADPCGFRCMQGAAEPRMTVTFKTVNPEGQQVKDMLAYNEPKQ